MTIADPGVDVSCTYLVTGRFHSPCLTATSSINKENSIEVIHLDILRTFPTLCFFQEVGNALLEF